MTNLGPKDVRNITHVLNYDYPNNSEDYIHRIGRTGVRTSLHSIFPQFADSGLQRAGMKGTSFTYFTTDNAKQARELIGILKTNATNILLPARRSGISVSRGGC